MKNMKRNIHIEVLLEELLGEIWKMDDGEFQLKPEPSIKIDGKWVYNPEFRHAIKIQKDVIWKKLSDHHSSSLMFHH